jgi:hypothetical protein
MEVPFALDVVSDSNGHYTGVVRPRHPLTMACDDRKTGVILRLRDIAFSCHPRDSSFPRKRESILWTAQF